MLKESAENMPGALRACSASASPPPARGRPPAVEKSVIGFLENRRTNFLQLQICRKYFTTAEFLFFHSSSYTTPLTFLQLANFYKI